MDFERKRKSYFSNPFLITSHACGGGAEHSEAEGENAGGGVMPLSWHDGGCNKQCGGRHYNQSPQVAVNFTVKQTHKTSDRIMFTECQSILKPKLSVLASKMFHHLMCNFYIFTYISIFSFFNAPPVAVWSTILVYMAY